MNSCQVEITTPNAALVNTDLAGMMNRRNRAIIGDEVVSFADTDEVAPGTWELSHWLRGRKGTETAAHAIGAPLVTASVAGIIVTAVIRLLAVIFDISLPEQRALYRRKVAVETTAIPVIKP